MRCVTNRPGPPVHVLALLMELQLSSPRSKPGVNKGHPSQVLVILSSCSKNEELRPNTEYSALDLVLALGLPFIEFKLSQNLGPVSPKVH